MWDCVAYIDDAALEHINKISEGKGLAHLVVSHPHYYSTTAVWLAAYPQCTIWLAEVDFHDFYQRRDIVADVVASKPTGLASRIKLVSDAKVVIDDAPAFTILRLGGHFPGRFYFASEQLF